MIEGRYIRPIRLADGRIGWTMDVVIKRTMLANQIYLPRARRRLHFATSRPGYEIYPIAHRSCSSYSFEPRKSEGAHRSACRFSSGTGNHQASRASERKAARLANQLGRSIPSPHWRASVDRPSRTSTPPRKHAGRAMHSATACMHGDRIDLTAGVTQARQHQHAMRRYIVADTYGGGAPPQSQSVSRLFFPLFPFPVQCPDRRLEISPDAIRPRPSGWVGAAAVPHARATPSHSSRRRRRRPVDRSWGGA